MGEFVREGRKGEGEVVRGGEIRREGQWEVWGREVGVSMLGVCSYKTLPGNTMERANLIPLRVCMGSISIATYFYIGGTHDTS